MNWLRVISLASLFLLLIPVAVLLYYGLGPLRSPAGYSVGVLRSIELSLVSSAAAAVVDVVLFTPLAYYLARGRDRLAETLVDVPVSVPHPIVGVALVILDSPRHADRDVSELLGDQFLQHRPRARGRSGHHVRPHLREGHAAILRVQGPRARGFCHGDGRVSSPDDVLGGPPRAPSRGSRALHSSR